MKFLVALVVVLMAATALLVLRNNGGAIPDIALPSLTKPKPARAAEAPKPAPAKTARVAKRKRVVEEAEPEPAPEAASQAEQAASSVTAEVTPAAPPKPRPPFPTADLIATGASVETVTGPYGSPSAWAVSSDDGHIVETLVYTEVHGGKSTVIRLVDGKIETAYTRASPASPTGTVVRDFGQQD